MKKILIYGLFPLFLSGCMVGPKFKSPEVATPQSYMYDSLFRAATNDTIALDWWQSFGDTTLTRLIETAIEGNKDFASALSNVEQARLKARSARAEMLPSLNLQIGANENYTYNTNLTQEYSGMLGVSWDLDLFGKLRSMAAAAKSDFLATQQGAMATRLTVTSEVANNYFALLQYKRNLEVAEETYKSREVTSAMMDSMFKYGTISLAELEQAKASMQTAKVAVAQYDRAVKQTMLALNLLMGEMPTPVIACEFAPETPHMEIPVGLPSSLLERRPDVMQAYYQVQAANSQIGVAIANRLPSISLTGQGGLLATFERDATSGKPLGWSVAGSIIQPLLNWGNNKRAVELAREQTAQATLNYEQTALAAINEVEQSLVSINTYREQLESARKVLDSSEKAQYLTKELYLTGSSSYLDMLDADRTLFSAQSQYWQTMQNYMTSYVSLYKALGGGW